MAFLPACMAVGIRYMHPLKENRKWKISVLLNGATGLAFLCLRSRQVGFVDMCVRCFCVYVRHNVAKPSLFSCPE